MDDFSVDDKLSKNKYITCENSHLVLNQEMCKKCKNKVCTWVCPAGVYTEQDDGTIKIEFENCLECKACKIACEKQAIRWEYPESGCGIVYKYS